MYQKYFQTNFPVTRDIEIYLNFFIETPGHFVPLEIFTSSANAFKEWEKVMWVQLEVEGERDS